MPAPVSTSHLPSSRAHTPAWLVATGLICSLLMFCVDLLTPNGIADPVGYVAIVLVSLWGRDARFPLQLASLASLLTCAGLLLAPNAGTQVQQGVVNHILALAVTWTTAFLCRQRLLAEAALHSLNQNLEEQVQRRVGELSTAQAHLAAEIHKREQAEQDVSTSQNLYSQAEIALRESEERKRAIFDAALDCMVIVDKDGKIAEFNRSAERAFGYRRDEVVGRDMSALLFAPASAARQRDNLTRYARTGEEGSLMGRRLEFPALKKNGETFVAEMAMQAIPLKGTPAFMVFVRDITSRKNAEQALKDSEALYHSLVEHLPMCLARKDPQGHFTFANRAFLQLAGLKLKDIVGKTDADLYPAELAEKYRADDLKVLESGKPFDDVEVHRTPGDETRYVQVQKAPVYDFEHKIVGTQVIFWDVTDRRRAEEELARTARTLEERNRALGTSEENLRLQTEILESVLRSLADGVVVIDENGKFLVWNPAAERIVGYGMLHQPGDASTVLGLYLLDRQTPFPLSQLPLTRAMRGEEVREVEMFIRNAKKPEGVIVSVNGTPLRDAEGRLRGGVIVFRDITQQKAAEQAVRDSEQRYRELAENFRLQNRDLETLLYVTSHDLREPLRAIENFSRLVADRYGERLDEKGRDFLRRVVAGAKRLDRLLDDVLTLSRAQRSVHPVDEVPATEIVDDVLKQLEDKIESSAAKVHVAEGLPRLRVDRRWATQAVYNLLVNALKFTRPGEPPEIEIAPYEPGPDDTPGPGLVVRDRGPGVSPEHAQRIFQLFQRAVGREVEGTGAGLAIVQQIAERHGGRAWVQPRPGGGSEFIMTFAPPVPAPV